MKHYFELFSLDEIIYFSITGVFEPSHMQYELLRTKEKEPSLTEMVEKAILLLQNDEEGFVLLVEGETSISDKQFI